MPFMNAAIISYKIRVTYLKLPEWAWMETAIYENNTHIKACNKIYI